MRSACDKFGLQELYGDRSITPSHCAATPGGPTGNRTQNPRIKSPLLCQLSYRPARTRLLTLPPVGDRNPQPGRCPRLAIVPEGRYFCSPVVPTGRLKAGPDFRVASSQSPSRVFDSASCCEREMDPLSQPSPKNDDESRNPQW